MTIVGCLLAFSVVVNLFAIGAMYEHDQRIRILEMRLDAAK